MKNLFDIDSGFMRFLGKVADIVGLNLIFLVCCLPIFTIGASITSLYYVTLKMVRKEEGYIIKGFFHSFKQNFKQATIIWMINLVIILILGVDVMILNQLEGTISEVLFVIVMAISIIVGFTTTYVYPLLSRFENSIKNTAKNALLLSIANLPKTVVLLISTVFLVVVCILNMRAFPLLFLCAFSLPAYSNSLILNGIFTKLEPKEKKVETEDEGIFKESDLLEENAIKNK